MSTDEVAKTSIPGAKSAVPSSASKPGETVTMVPGTGVQDLSQDSLLSMVPRIEFNGSKVPAVGGIALLSKLGQGGMGAVYFGIHPRLKSEVAVKILPFQMASQQPALVQRFYREAQIAAKVKSPHLVGVMDVNEEHGLFYLVMEFVQGVSAGSHLRSQLAAGAGALPEATALAVCIAACEGLAVAHEQNVIHRDIKPDNILIPKMRGNELNFTAAKLADLGLARFEDADSSLTANQSTMGTPGYMAPEQANDARQAGKHSDVFSLGATLYALVCGEPPFQETTALSTILASIQKPHRPITNFRNDLTPATTEVIERCLSKTTEARYTDAAALLQALQNCYAAVGPLTLPGTVVGSRPAVTLPRQSSLGAAAQKQPPSSVVDTIEVGQVAARASQPPAATPATKNRAPLLAAVAVPVLALIAYFIWRQPEAPRTDTAATKNPVTAPLKTDLPGDVGKTASNPPVTDPQDTERQVQQAIRETKLSSLKSAAKDAAEALGASERNFAEVSKSLKSAQEAEAAARVNSQKSHQAVDEAQKNEQATGKTLMVAVNALRMEEAKQKEDEKLHGPRPLKERMQLQPFKADVDNATKAHDAAAAKLAEAREEQKSTMKAHQAARTAADTAQGSLDAAQKDLDAARATAEKKKKELQDFDSAAPDAKQAANPNRPQNASPGAYKLYEGPCTVETVDKVTLKDSAHNRTIALRIYYPKLTPPKKCPVIVFSHGWPSSDGDYQALSHFWSSHGYICIHPSHASDPSGGGERPAEKLIEAFTDTVIFENRCRDISFVLDSFTEIKNQVPALKPLLDAERIAVAGHSTGAQTAQLLAGATIDFPNGDKNKSFADNRIKAVLLLAPPGRGAGLTDDSWKNFKLPLLSVIGSLDYPRFRSADWRKDPFKLSPSGDKYQLLIDGAHHGLGGIMGATPKGLDRIFGADVPEQCDWIKTSSLAFFDAYLNNYPDAKAYLQSDSLQKLGDAKFSFERR